MFNIFISNDYNHWFNGEKMIIGFIGKMGSGKTLCMTKFAHEYFQKGNKVYANYGLLFEHEKVKYSDIKNMSKDLIKSVICLDEIHVFIDSRSSMKAVNRQVSYFVTQSRKRNLILMYTTQKFGQVDKRLRENTDYVIKCSNKKKNGQLFIRCHMIDSDDKERKFTINANKIFGMYDTHEVVNPFED